MTQSSLLAFAVVGQQAEETREQHPTFEDQYRNALYQAVKSDAPFLDRISKEMPQGWRPGQPLVQ